MTTAQCTSEEAATPTTVLRRFRVVFNAVRTHFRQMEKDVGLGGAQIWALAVIKANPGIGMGGVANQMEIHQSTASNLIKTLLRKELISLTKAADDRRNVCLTILPAGARLLKRVPGPFEGVLPQALGQMDVQALQRLDQDLGALISLLNADESAAQTPLAQL